MKEKKELYYVTYCRPLYVDANNNLAITYANSDPIRTEYCRARLGYLTEEVKVLFEKESDILSNPDEFRLQSWEKLGLSLPLDPSNKEAEETYKKNTYVHKRLMKTYNEEIKSKLNYDYLVKLQGYQDHVKAIAEGLKKTQARRLELRRLASDGNIPAPDSPSPKGEQLPAVIGPPSIPNPESQQDAEVEDVTDAERWYKKMCSGMTYPGICEEEGIPNGNRSGERRINRAVEEHIKKNKLSKTWKRKRKP